MNRIPLLTVLSLALAPACHKDCPTYHSDADGDGYGADEVQTCDPGADTVKGAISGAIDCDDGDPEVHPDLPDGDAACDGVDNDCDDAIDEDTATWYVDADGDGYGDSALFDTLTACQAAEGYAATAGDCDDTAAATYPGAFEVCSDGVDENCDGLSGDEDRCALSGAVEISTLILVGGGWQMAGTSAAVVGDLDGDGLPDLAVGDTTLEVVTLCSGVTGAPLQVITGGEKSAFGAAMTAGDFDGDGSLDLAVGAPRTLDGVGEVDLWYGDDFTRSSIIATRSSYRLFGLTVGTLPSEAGPDGLTAELRVPYDDAYVPDLALMALPAALTDTTDVPKIGPFSLGSWPLSLGLSPDGGALSVGYSGEDGSTGGGAVYGISALDAASLDASLQTSDTTLGLGASVALLDNVGRLTLLVGAPDATFGKGQIYAVNDAANAGAVGISDADWAFSGTPGTMIGAGLGLVGDVNGDGLLELGVGGATRAWLLFGSAEGWSGGSIVQADAALSGFGDAVRSLQGAGDVNGDGYDDVVFSDGSTVTLLFGGPLPAGSSSGEL